MNRYIWLLLLLLVLGLACVVAVMKVDVAPPAEKAAPPVRQQDLAENVSVAQHGLYGVTLVSIGKAHIRKLRKGPFTIGAINELVLEDVALTLPSDKPETAASSEDAEGETRPKELLRRLGIDAGRLKMGSKMPRFSALSMRNLRVSRLYGETNAVPWFAAQQATARRSGLEMANGWSVEKGVTNVWREALLAVKPTLRVIPGGR